jgi:hypothetical protein
VYYYSWREETEYFGCVSELYDKIGMNEFIYENTSLVLLMGIQELQVQETPSVRVFDDIQDLVQ